jgi:hypothetical protein
MVSPGYRAFLASPEWRMAKARHWASRWTIKSCVVCGARRGERPLDVHHLVYRSRRDGSLRAPRRWELVSACAYPCHRLLITPLSRAPFLRGAVICASAALSLHLGAPVVPALAVAVALLALPRIPEATALCFLLGLPARLARALARLAR